ncbi:MAG: hypothetical protein ACODAD_02495 [Planctomycetota bacterium]
MSDSSGKIAGGKLRVPSEDGEAVVEPCFTDPVTLPRQNQVRQARMSACCIGGGSLSRLRAMAREELLQRAARYTSSYREIAGENREPDAPVILAGHQPRLVHPGVWFKNFLLSELARRGGAHAINLVIDSDLARHTSIHVPSGSLEAPTISSLALDTPTFPLPHEARAIQDFALFASFGRRVEAAISPFVDQPLLGIFWPYAVQAARKHGNLGQALAQARHRLEGDWGLNTLELPLSAVCGFRAFGRFAIHLLANAPRFRAIHNRYVAEYRLVHKVRNHTHPVPDLVEDDGWTEVPFWLWTLGQPRRLPAFVRQSGRKLVLSDREDVHLALDLGLDAESHRGIEQLDEARRQGFQLRPRALITTLFSRLVMGDLFIHGIGGAKYDQVTDAIVRRFFGVAPPDYVTASATFKLPVPRPTVDPSDLRRVKWLLRELYYHPELYVDATSETLPLIAEKRGWIEAELPPERLRERHEGIVRVNEALRATLQARREQLWKEQITLQSQLRKKAILDSREYAFCLFPVENLRDRLLDLARRYA